VLYINEEDLVILSALSLIAVTMFARSVWSTNVFDVISGMADMI